jgi:hypothetical protein
VTQFFRGVNVFQELPTESVDNVVANSIKTWEKHSSTAFLVHVQEMGIGGIFISQQVNVSQSNESITARLLLLTILYEKKIAYTRLTVDGLED